MRIAVLDDCQDAARGGADWSRLGRYATRENYDAYFPQVMENIAAFLTGSPIWLLAHD